MSVGFQGREGLLGEIGTLPGFLVNMKWGSQRKRLIHVDSISITALLACVPIEIVLLAHRFCRKDWREGLDMKLAGKPYTYTYTYTHIYIYIYGDFLKWGYPEIIHS